MQERFLQKMVREIAAEEGIQSAFFSQGYVISLTWNGKNAFIIGNKFGINNASISAICSDKCAASDIMTHMGIPNVRHYFFNKPTRIEYVGADGNYPEMRRMLDLHGRLVLKDNTGTGGNHVYLVTNGFELENAAQVIFHESRSLAVSKYHEIDAEYRVIMLGGEARLVFSKERESVTGDGRSTVRELCRRAKSDGREPANLPDRVLERGEVYHLNWRHNLGQGATPSILGRGEAYAEITGFARNVAAKLGLGFVSIDIIRTENTYMVLEINSGVMMEVFARQSAENYGIAKGIYRDAIKTMLDIR